QGPSHVLGGHLQDREAWALGLLTEPCGELPDLVDARNHNGLSEAARRSKLRKIDALASVAHLHSGLAEMVVVDYDDIEVVRIGDRDGGKAAEAHELLAIAGDDEHAAVGTCLRDPKPDQGSTAHRPPEIVV